MSKSREAKLNALNGLKSKMSDMGGDSLNAYKDGGVVKASVTAKNKDDLKKGLKKAASMMDDYEVPSDVESARDEAVESGDEFSELSREDLLKRLRK